MRSLILFCISIANLVPILYCSQNYTIPSGSPTTSLSCSASPDSSTTGVFDTPYIIEYYFDNYFGTTSYTSSAAIPCTNENSAACSATWRSYTNTTSYSLSCLTSSTFANLSNANYFLLKNLEINKQGKKNVIAYSNIYLNESATPFAQYMTFDMNIHTSSNVYLRTESSGTLSPIISLTFNTLLPHKASLYLDFYQMARFIAATPTSCDEIMNRIYNIRSDAVCVLTETGLTIVNAIVPSILYEPSTERVIFQIKASYITNVESKEKVYLSVSSFQLDRINRRKQIEIISGFYDTSAKPPAGKSALDYSQSCSSNCIYCLSSGSCTVCNSGYYLSGSSCASCTNNCIKCLSSSVCSECQSGMALKSDGTCGCPDLCETCELFEGNVRCLTCIGEGDPQNKSTILNTQTGRCKCLPNFYYNVSEKSCLSCHSTCSNCTGPLESECLKCLDLDHLELRNEKCQCTDGFLLYISLPDENNKTSVECRACHQNCKTCKVAGDESKCIDCITGMQNQTSDVNGHRCMCSSDRYLDENNVCKKCHPLCLQCTTNATYCPLCQNSAYNIVAESNTCKCKPGYFFDIKTNSSICGVCNILCDTCTDEATICQSCKSSMNAILDGNQCECANGYYLTENSTCAPCHGLCETCDGKTNSDCLSCRKITGVKMISENYCDCQDGFAFISTQQKCDKCNFLCTKCANSTYICTECRPDITHLLLVGTSCQCEESYFMDTDDYTCRKCHPLCSSCFGPFSNQCTDCNTELQAELVVGTCQCISGKKYDSVGIKCVDGSSSTNTNSSTLIAKKTKCVFGSICLQYKLTTQVLIIAFILLLV